MTTRRDQIIDSLRDKEAREAFVQAHIETGVAFQIKTNRDARKWSQGDLGARAGMKQSAISRLENPRDSLPNLSTLERIAAAMDVALIVRFVSFGELFDWGESLGDRDLFVESFAEDTSLFSASLVDGDTLIGEMRTFSGGQSMQRIGDNIHRSPDVIDFEQSKAVRAMKTFPLVG
jgi:transcriptional regulator with XRE-family HTH domain